MTDVPPGNDGPAGDPDPDAPQGIRRSNFTPPQENAAPPSFDDDALADVLAAQVSSYTAPIMVTPPPAPTAVPESAAPPEPTAGPASAEPPTPAAEPQPPVEEEPPAEPTSTIDTSSSATLDAIERLESELRRRAEEAQAVASAPVEVAPVLPPVLAPVLPPVPPALPPDAHVPPDGERLFPSPFRPFATAPIPTAAEPFAEPPSFPTPPSYAEPPSNLEPPSFPEPASFPPPPSDPEPPSFELPEPEHVEEHPPSWDAAPPPMYSPPPLVEPPSFGMPEPIAPVPFESEPPPPGAAAFDAPPPNPGFGTPPLTPSIDLPPPGETAAVDLAHLPPPRGIEPVALPPYDSPGENTGTGSLTPLAVDFESLLGVPHLDDLPGQNFAAPEGAASSSSPSEDDDDVVDDVDRAFRSAPLAVDSTGAVDVVSPPSQPIATMRLADDEAALVDEELEQHPAFLVEQAGAEPTPHDLRAGRAARMFWLWFAANSSVVSLAVGAVLFGMGMSLRQVLVAILIGVAISFLPLGLVTLAGKWSGQPTMILSRATFGLVGNALPAVLALISRVFWGGALLWMLSAAVASVLVDAGLDAGLGVQVWTLIGLGVGFVLAFVVAIFGYGLIARLQLILIIVTGLLVVGLIVITYPHVDLAVAQNVVDGPWILLVTGIVLVFSFVGLAWVHSSGDIARYQRVGSDGGSTMLWATFGATVPAFLLIGWGALLAASDPVLADALAVNPVHAVASLLPLWYPAPLLAATALGLLSGVVLTIYSGGFALTALGVRGRRSFTTVVAGILVLAMAAGLVFLVTDARDLIRNVATTIAVPVAAWAGIFGAEVIVRSRLSAGFHSDSLLRRGGVYPAVRWVNLIGLIVITAVGFGLTSAVLPGLDWQGYLLPFLGLGADDPLLSSDVGVLVALVLGILLPLISAVPTIRRQSQALVDSGA